MRNWMWIACFLVMAFSPQSEEGLVAWISFDECKATDLTGLNTVKTMGRPDCGCGAKENALYLDGIDDHISLQGAVDEAFKGAYTLSFYFKTYARSIKQVLLSKRMDCSFDGPSVLEVRHLQPCGDNTTGRIWSETSPKGKRSVGVAYLEESTWRHVAVVRIGQEQVIYINGLEADRRDFRYDPVDLTNAAPLLLGYGPCVAESAEEERNRYFPLIGAIDEVRIYNRPLSSIEIQKLYSEAPIELAEIGCSS